MFKANIRQTLRRGLLTAILSGISCPTAWCADYMEPLVWDGINFVGLESIAENTLKPLIIRLSARKVDRKLRTLFLPSNFCNLFAMLMSSIINAALILPWSFFFMGSLGLSNAFTCIAFELPADSTGLTVWTFDIDKLFFLSDFFSFGFKPRSYCATECNFSSSWSA